MARVLAVCVLLSSRQILAVRRDFKADKPAVQVLHVLDQATSMVQKVRGGEFSPRLNQVLETVQLNAVRDTGSETPGASDSMTSILSSTIASLTTDVQDPIKAAFQSTQDESNKRMDLLADEAQKLLTKKKNADRADNDWVDCVGDQKTALEELEAAQAAASAAAAASELSCEEAQNLQMFKEEPELAELTVSCDLSVEGQCDAEMADLQAEVDKVVADVNTSLEAAQAAYDSAAATCAADTEATDKAIAASTAASEGFASTEAECQALWATDQTDMCTFVDKYDAKCKAGESCGELIYLVGQEGNVYSEPDREAEWAEVTSLKCVLQKWLDGEDITDAVVTECDASVDYKSQVGVLDLRMGEFSGYMSGEYYTCGEESISFSGYTWTIPEGGAAASSADYVKSPYEAPLTKESGDFNFPFCE